MSYFTQGPFSVAETRHKYDTVIRGPKNEPIALVLIAGFSKKEGAANASLLAAAPDLLEALKRCKFDSLNMTLEDREFCRAAISKAYIHQ